MGKILKADKGKIYTNGEIYGIIIDLADDMDDKGFHQITEEEYNAKLQSEVPEDQIFGGDNNHEVM